MNRIKQSVLNNRVGSGCSRARGLSIYYPRKLIHHSYEKTKFAQDTNWLSFIKEFKVSSKKKIR